MRGASWYTFSAKTLVTRSVSGCRRVASCCGNSTIEKRASTRRSSCTRSAAVCSITSHNSSKCSLNISIRSSTVAASGRVKPQIWPRSLSRSSPNISTNPATRSHLLTSRYTGSSISSRPITSSIRSRKDLARTAISSASPCRSVTLTATKMPFTGFFGRVWRSKSRKDSHSSWSASCVAQRPAVSRIMASLLIHQSQLRVPPTPRTRPPLACGNGRPELRSAVVLPAPGGPTIRYQGRAPRASPPLCAKRETLRLCRALRNSACMAAISAC